MKKSFIHQLKSFVVGCYKRILGIHKEDLTRILGVNRIEKIWERKRINEYSHIARLHMIIRRELLFLGKMMYDPGGVKRKFFNVKRMMKDINKYPNEATYCNLCDRKIRSGVYTDTS